MKQFLKVLEFEFTNYFKSKSYILTTVLISLLLIVGLSLPSFFDMSSILPFLEDTSQEQSVEDSDTTEKDIENTNLAIYDPNSLIDEAILENYFPNSTFEYATSENELTKLVKEEKAESGFMVNSLSDFDYFVNDSSFNDYNQMSFESMLSFINRFKYATDNNLNFEELESVYNSQVSSNTTILGKDGVNNFMYAYILIFILYFMILMYGQLIATSVTTEKSNRSIEILVTSIDTTSLICGKVIAASVASFIQFGTMLASGMISYSINRDSWNGILDNIFNIPADILLIFILFGCTGYLFYAFIFGTLGALVSKTEDIASSITSITLIFMVVFFVTIFGMQNADSVLMKVSSFIPFSSCLTMPTRFAMGSVSTVEIIISFIILVISTGIVAFIASKIYRMATLRYGNPIKLKDSFKALKKGSF